MLADAVIFREPGAIDVDHLSLVEPEPADVVVDVRWSGISTGTEKLLWRGEMPWFPGLGYPLVPGYEAVGDVVQAGPESGHTPGDRVFVPGATCFEDARGLFGASASRLVVPGRRVTPVARSLQDRAVLLSLAATAQHAIARHATASRSRHEGPVLIAGHGVLGRLMARLMIARGDPAPTVWEAAEHRFSGATGYRVVHSDDDPEKAYATIFDATGDTALLDTQISRLAHGGEVVLAGFYAQPVTFSFPPAFMREARLRVVAEWKPEDLAEVLKLLGAGRFDLDGLISHRRPACDAPAAYEQAFNDAACTKMVLTWSDAT